MSNFNLTINDSDNDEIEIQRDTPFEFKIPSKKIDIVNDNMLFNKANISNDIFSSRSSSSMSNDNNRRNNIIMSDDDADTKSSSKSSQVIKRNYGRDRMENDINQKKEILYQFDRLKSKGINVPYTFDMSSELEDMRLAYERVKREKDIDSSVKFQRKMLMGFVTGVEYVNSRFDPFGVFLQGFSEQLHGELDEYDEIFEELHDKYQMSDSQMAPELRLAVSLGGSAFMFHLTNKMFDNEKLPKVEEVLRSNPNLMKQFQNAAAENYMSGGNERQFNNTTRSEPVRQSGGNDIFSMVSGLFGNMNTEPVMDHVDSIINNVHQNISVIPSDENNVETMTVTDDEINSIIEETADIKVLSGNEKPKRKRKNNNRTLNL